MVRAGSRGGLHLKLSVNFDMDTRKKTLPIVVYVAPPPLSCGPFRLGKGRYIKRICGAFGKSEKRENTHTQTYIQKTSSIIAFFCTAPCDTHHQLLF